MGAHASRGRHGVAEEVGWWSAARYVQTGLFVGVLLAVLLALFGRGGFESGRWPISLLVAALGIVLSLMVVAILRRSGRQEGSAAASEYRAVVVQELTGAIERRVGRPLRETLRVRSELSSALGLVKLQSREFRAGN